MLYKINNTEKYSFFAGAFVCLLASTALSQSPLPNEVSAPANVQIAIDQTDNTDEGLPSNTDNAGDLGSGLSQPAPLPVPGAPILPADNLPQSPDNSDAIASSGPQLINPQPPLNAGIPGPQDANMAGNTPEQGDNPVLNAYNNFVENEDRQALNAPIAADADSSFSDKIMDQVKEDLFSQMADIEKQTGLLTLELKREKIKNEIAAMKAQRQRAIEEEQEKERERVRKQAEWEEEQKRLLLAEQRKLEEVKIRYEKLRQERVLKAYKESMLKNNQQWVEYNARLYNQLVKEEAAQNKIIEKQKEFFASILSAVNRAGTAAETAKEKYTKEISSLQTQISVLKAKLEAERAKREQAMSGNKGGESSTVKASANPFALIDDESMPKKKIAEEYAIMEISGKGDVLVAKLINKKGGTFMVKQGTVLNTGHVIENITQTYIEADRGGTKDYLYFSAGGILDKEPTSSIAEDAAREQSKRNSATTNVPNLREGMYVE